MCKVSAERPYECLLPYLSNARLCSSRTPVPVDMTSLVMRRISSRRCESFGIPTL